ncbi:MAG: hypothetical protein SFW67_34360 [Myxococcaceae bacterium]|nr:hypothetical protein [Myxococcaceae bacterium]
MRRLVVIGVFLFGACRPTGVSMVDLEVRATPEAVDFGAPWTQVPVSRTVVLSNLSRRSAEIVLEVAGTAFRLDEVNPGLGCLAGDEASGVAASNCPPNGLTLTIPPGDTDVLLTGRADVAGLTTGRLRALVEGAEAVSVELVMVAREPPDCGEASECATLRFDRVTNQCVTEPRPDGLSCGALDRCLVGGQCRAGECVGTPVRCDDGDPCTLDVCETVRGCVALPAACGSPSPCLVGVCSRAAGCTTAPVVDGVRCGDVSSDSCTSVNICLDGQCVARDPPDGFRCAEATPCRGEGRCEGDVCVTPPAAPLVAGWSLGGPTEDGGIGDQWSDVFITAGGGVTLSSYFATAPMVNAGPLGQRLPMASRRCIAWSDLVVCADAPPQAVTAVSASTGLPVFSYTRVLDDLPALALPDWETFLARLVSLGPSRLGVVYESRRLDDGRETNCRRFSLVVLDDTGQRVVARLIEDPIFQTCNHPHSYGVASDPQGNVFFAFTQSARVSPALPDPQAPGTVIMSYSPAGVLRWRHFVQGMPGGEIAVGRGLLTVESGRSLYDSARGVAIDTFSLPFGEGLITDEWVVASPKGVQAELRAPTTGRGPAVLEAPATAVSQSGLRGARWGGQPVALRFISTGASTALEAFPLDRFQTGSIRPLWSCELQDGGVPVAFEVRAGGVAVMTDVLPGWAGRCEFCDPPYAGTRGRFLDVEVPGLVPPRMPWAGPWGGPGHDHQEH